MKTMEQVQKRIATLESIIEDLRGSIEKEMLVVQKRIAANANDPEHISKWIGSWMSSINYSQEMIQVHYKELEILGWVLNN